MDNTSKFNQTGLEQTQSHTLSRGERALALIKDSYDLHGPSEATFSLLQSALKLEPFDRLNLAEHLKAVHDVLREPDDAKTVRLERVAPTLPSHKFDPDIAFSADRQRGGDPKLAKILNGLSGVDSPLPDSPIVPKLEPEAQRNIEAREYFQTDTSKILSEGRKALYGEVLQAVLHENHGFSIRSNHAFARVADTIKGGKEACEKITSISQALSIFAYHNKNGLSVQESVATAARYVSGEKRLTLMHGI